MAYRCAAIDVGTNTALLLIADVDEEGRLVPLLEKTRFVRLGEGVDASRTFRSAALERLRHALLEFRVLAEEWDVQDIVIGATSASRDIQDRDFLVEWVHRETGLQYSILSGLEEATWSFRGALTKAKGLAGPCTTIDIGGGSTEFVTGDTEGTITGRYSLDIGSVRLTERFWDGSPATTAAIAHAEKFVKEQLMEVFLNLNAENTFIGASSSPYILLLMHHDALLWEELSSYTLSCADVRGWAQRLLGMRVEDIRALSPVLMEGRADVFAAAILILDTVLQHFTIPSCRISPHGLRHGLVLRALERRNNLPSPASTWPRQKQ